MCCAESAGAYSAAITSQYSHMKWYFVIALVVVIAGAILFGMKGAPESSGVTGDSNNATKSSLSSGTIADLFAMSGSYKCTISSDVTSGLASGVVYVSNGRVRGDFVAQSAGESINVSMIQNDGYVYNWSDAMPQGIKVKAVTDGNATDGAESGQLFDATASIQYSCEPSEADEGLFTPPTSVQFMELPAGLPQVPGMGR